MKSLSKLTKEPQYLSRACFLTNMKKKKKIKFFIRVITLYLLINFKISSDILFVQAKVGFQNVNNKRHFQLILKKVELIF